jgi:hypothetical protein
MGYQSPAIESTAAQPQVREKWIVEMRPYVVAPYPPAMPKVTVRFIVLLPKFSDRKSA